MEPSLTLPLALSSLPLPLLPLAHLQTTDPYSQDSSIANSLHQFKSKPSLKRGKNKRRQPPSPPPPPLRNTRSRTVAHPETTAYAVYHHSTVDAPALPAQTLDLPVDQPIPPPTLAATAPRLLEEQPAPIQLDAEEETSKDVDLVRSAYSEGGGCGSARRRAEIELADTDGIGVEEVNEQGASGGGLGALFSLSDGFSALEQQSQANASMIQPLFSLDFQHLDPLASLPHLPDLYNLDFGFDFLQPPPQPLEQLSSTPDTSQAPLPSPHPAIQPSTSSGCCGSRFARPTTIPEDNDVDLALLRAEDIETYDFGGGGAAWPISSSTRTFGMEREQQEGHGGEMDEWEEDARVRAELIAAGFC